jgi:hypothetical protein
MERWRIGGNGNEKFLPDSTLRRARSMALSTNFFSPDRSKSFRNRRASPLSCAQRRAAPAEPVQDLTVFEEFRAEFTRQRSSRSPCAAVASQSKVHCRSNTARIQRDRAGKPAVQKPWVSRADSRVRTWVKSRFFIRGKRSRRGGDGGRGRFARSNLPTREQDGASALLLTSESTAVEAQ